MKKLVTLIIFLIIAAIGVTNYSAIAASANDILYQSPCKNPKTFRVGNIDSKYSMTKDQFIQNISEAGDIWSSQYGQKLFLYDEKGEIEVNLVYDQRQFLSTQISDLNSSVKDQQNELDPKIESYKNRSSIFAQKAAKLNSEIEYWNSQGGAPPEEFNRLKSAQESLRTEAEQLKAEANSLNFSTDLYNQKVGQLQETVNSFNSALQFKPEEGEYIYDNGKETINIYFDNSETQLVHTLAHELGHSLSIAHNNNPFSIMFPQSTDSVKLTVEDVSGLTKACAEKSIIALKSQKLSVLIHQIKLNIAKEINK